MDYHETLSALLPRPRDDEPARLRHDIVDELADHLTCAYHHELIRGTDPAAAKACTLQRFGDPAAVARRLWLDAMKGKIMAQRILIATCLLFMVACLWLAVGAAQQSGQSAATLTYTNRRIVDLLTQTQTTNQEMLRHLQAMDNAAQSRQAVESCNVAFRLNLEMPNGPPGAGFDIRLGRGYGGSTRSDAQSGTSDERGAVDFEVGLPGDWEFTISRVSSASTANTQGNASIGLLAMGGTLGNTSGDLTWKTQGIVKLVAGSGVVKHIVCPKLPPETSPLKVRVDWPADLADKNLYVEAQFVYTGVNLDTTTPWSVENLSRPNFYQTREVLCGPGPRQSEIIAPDQLYLWRFADGKSSSSTSGLNSTLVRNPVFGDIPSGILQSGPNGLEFEEGCYRLSRLIVLRPSPRQSEKFKGERFDLIAHAESVSSFALPVYQCEEFPDQASPIGVSSESDADKKIGRVLLSSDYWREAESLGDSVRREFEVEAGTGNLWTIQVPEELSKVIRDRLNLKEPPKAKTGE
jgi:hypothetical protein